MPRASCAARSCCDSPDRPAAGSCWPRFTAFVAGEADHVLDQQITMGGAAESPGPFTVVLDLSGAAPGATVVLLVRVGTGLETDPGEFGAIPVTITR